ncbi:riboflavin synthase [Mariniphaga sediminis]|jgi:riboflavin synthase|uniref:Riboflavin synthase n=1 Tax=Mariniphaga sediminis TaxID=1628158 RepID=A0A399D629_9BACT|nr:riboflavin synthase [Mariniphaga sediminis]RIH65890.1 riboflavin synthase [Mariniphaga sediminis]
MFSGIIEEFGTVTAIEKDQENVHFTLTCSFAGELKVDQSLSHNGVCLTVVEVDKEKKTYKVTAIKETLLKSNLGGLEVGSKVNLERSMAMNGRLDGHIVQGHVDQTAICTRVEEADGSWYYTFEYDFDVEKAKQGYMTVEKGSVSVNGVSLTVVNSKDNSFQVAIIPFTQEVTNFHTFREGTVVNLEFDIIGKYLGKLNTYANR